MKCRVIASLVVALIAGAAYGTSTAVTDLLKEYRQESASAFSANAGRKLWRSTFKDSESGQLRRCASCHTDDLRQPGKHVRTGKRIAPLAPSVNPQRLTDSGKIKKWLRRNCKWTLGRECTAKEKGDVLTYLQGQ